MQFRPCFTFVLLPHLHLDKDIEWNYNEADHGKGPMDRTDGTIKNKVFQEIKSGRIVADSPKDFAMHESCIVQSITLYHPKKNIFEEPACIENASYIKCTLDVHKVKRKRNDHSIIFLEFNRLSLMKNRFILIFIENLVI